VPSRVLVLHGPNLNLLFDLAELDAQLEEHAERLGLDLKTFHSNSEGALVDALHAERTRVSGIIVNAARLAPVAEVLAEALELVKRPAIEVVTEPNQKARSALKGAVRKQLSGKDAYTAALDALAAELKQTQSRPTSMMAQLKDASSTLSDDPTGPISHDEVKKSLGRKSASSAGVALLDRPRKSIGRARVTSKVDDERAGLTRETVREKIAERLSGRLSSSGLATWARGQWQELQRGAPVENGQREHIEDVLQTLLLAGASKANDHQLIELMTQLG
jgi:3-dehydroquinate dehydratase-2